MWCASTSPTEPASHEPPQSHPCSAGGRSRRPDAHRRPRRLWLSAPAPGRAGRQRRPRRPGARSSIGTIRWFRGSASTSPANRPLCDMQLVPRYGDEAPPERPACGSIRRSSKASACAMRRCGGRPSPRTSRPRASWSSTGATSRLSRPGRPALSSNSTAVRPAMSSPLARRSPTCWSPAPGAALKPSISRFEGQGVRSLKRPPASDCASGHAGGPGGIRRPLRPSALGRHRQHPCRRRDTNPRRPRGHDRQHGPDFGPGLRAEHRVDDGCGCGPSGPRARPAPPPASSWPPSRARLSPDGSAPSCPRPRRKALRTLGSGRAAKPRWTAAAGHVWHCPSRRTDEAGPDRAGRGGDPDPGDQRSSCSLWTAGAFSPSR